MEKDDKRFRPLERSDPEFYGGDRWLRENGHWVKTNFQTDPDARPPVWIHAGWVREVPVGDESDITATWKNDQTKKRPGDSFVEYDRDREIDWKTIEREKDRKRDQQPHRKKDRHKESATERSRKYRAKKKAEQEGQDDGTA
jgi:hypothetical protein